jgi:DNA modification methylase
MKPYFQEGGITIYHGDCREVVPSVHADATVCDAPYGLGIDYGSFIDTPESVRALMADVIPMLRIATGRVAVTCGVARMWDYPAPDWTLCWAISGAGSTGKWGFSCWQPILVYGQDPFLTNGLGRRPDLIFKNETSPECGHPCPKPEGFMRLLVNRVSLESESVLDPFMGSGTTLVAAKNLGRKAIGIEIEERYCEIAVKRLAQGVMEFA